MPLKLLFEAWFLLRPNHKHKHGEQWLWGRPQHEDTHVGQRSAARLRYWKIKIIKPLE